MNRLFGLILLQNQDATSLCVIRIIFDHHGGSQAIDDVMHENTIRCEFFVPMERDQHFAACHE